MKNSIPLIEIPAADFRRAVKFYENVLSIRLTVCDSCEEEKMAFFYDFTHQPNISISWAPDFRPSSEGVLIHLTVEDIEASLALIEKEGGKIVRPKTKIDAESMGYFALFLDSEGNRLGLYSEK